MMQTFHQAPSSGQACLIFLLYQTVMGMQIQLGIAPGISLFSLISREQPRFSAENFPTYQEPNMDDSENVAAECYAACLGRSLWALAIFAHSFPRKRSKSVRLGGHFLCTQLWAAQRCPLGPRSRLQLGHSQTLMFLWWIQPSSIWMHVFVALKGEINLHFQASTWGLCAKLNWCLEGDADPWFQPWSMMVPPALLTAGLLPAGCGVFTPSTAFGIKVTKWNNVPTDYEIFLETFYTYLGNFNVPPPPPFTDKVIAFLRQCCWCAHGSAIFPPFDDDSSPCSVVSNVLDYPPSLTQWNLWCFGSSLQTAERLNFISSVHLACEVHTLNWQALKLFFDKSANCILNEYWRKEEKSSFHAAHLPCRSIKWAGHSVVVKWKSCQSSVATSQSLGNINQKF